jgi:hypothetical protein
MGSAVARRADQTRPRVTFEPNSPRKTIRLSTDQPISVAVDPLSPNLLIAAGKDRNEQRVREANTGDDQMIGKSYLNNDVGAHFKSSGAKGPDDTFTPPDWFLPKMKEIAATPVKSPAKASFRFTVSPEAAEHNAELLRGAGYDIPTLMATQKGTTADYGSEFRPTEQLRELLSGHPGFRELSSVIDNGMDYRFSRLLTETERNEEMLGNLQRGNHKSAEDNTTVVAELLQKEVHHGFTWVIPRELVPLIPGSMVEPLGLAEQWTLNTEGDRVPKYRLTQDLSFTFSKDDRKRSVNSRIDMAAYPEMIYG